MRRVVITGMGIVSSLGSDVNAVADSLKAGKSGIGFVETYKEKARCYKQKFLKCKAYFLSQNMDVPE